MCSHVFVSSKDRFCAACGCPAENGAQSVERIPFERRAVARPADRLSIRHDLGTMDTHVVAIHVSRLSATLTYTDTPRSRAALLRKVLEPYHLCRKTKAPAPGTPYELRAGLFTSDAHADLEQQVNRFGSHFALRIDRNSARKQLERFVKRADTIVLLTWAAAGNVGQCAILQEGNIHLICTAIAREGSAQMRLGIRLDELLSCDSAGTFLLTALGIVTAGLMNHHPLRLISEDIESALLRYLQSTDQAVLTAAFDHALLVSARLDRIRGALVRLKGEASQTRSRSTHVAHNWDKYASDIANRSSRLLHPANHGHHLHPLLTEAGAAAEALEQAAFTLTFMPRDSNSKDIALLGTLAELVNLGARGYVRCLEDARDIRRTPAPARADLERFLVTIDQVADVERRSSSAARAIETALTRDDLQQPVAVVEVAGALLHAVESLARCSVIARDYVFSGRAGDK